MENSSNKNTNANNTSENNNIIYSKVIYDNTNNVASNDSLNAQNNNTNQNMESTPSNVNNTSIEQNKPQIIEEKPVKNNKKSKKKKKKRKKLHIKLFIFLAVFSVLVVFPIGFFSIFILDYSTETVPEGKLDVNTLKNKLILESIEETGKEDSSNYGKVSLSTDETMMNNIFMYLTNKINIPNYIPKMYCKIDGENYIFYLELQASVFKTRLSLDTKLTYNDDELRFTINAIKIGKFKVPDSFLDFVLDKCGITDDWIKTAISNVGFNVTVNLKDKYIRYSKENFFNDIGKITNVNDNLYGSLIIALLKKGASVNTNGKISINLDLSSFHEVKDDDGNNKNINYINPSFKKINFEKIIKNVKTVIANNKETFYVSSELVNDNVKKLYQYLLRGYDYYNNNQDSDETAAEIIKFVTPINFKGYNDQNNDITYKDIKIDEGLATDIDNFTDCVTLNYDESQLTEIVSKLNAGEEYKILDINESSLNEYLKNSSLIGFSTMVSGTVNPNTNESRDVINFITIDNMNLNFLDEKNVEMFITISVNGYCITAYSKLTIDNSSEPNPSNAEFKLPLLKLVFDLDSIQIGENIVSDIDPNLSDKLIQVIKSYFVNDLTGGIKIVIPEKSEETQKRDSPYILLNLNNIAEVQQNIEILNALITTCGFNFDYNATSSQKDNKISFAIKKHNN